jgi:thioredoxin reductase/NAD-dependent dihydropyrimidine dehydrogenase PreA subunit
VSVTLVTTGLIYGIPIAVVVGGYIALIKLRERASKHALAESRSAGLTEPASLHPVIDQSLCIGCTSCVRACPEQSVLGIVGGKAELINPTHCIGHGACRTACPMGAITLVFGTEKRGVDIPLVGPNFETNVRGIFIAGELGGMGLIRNAITQGRQAVEAIQEFLKSRGRTGRGPGRDLDLVIVGAGPAGFAASLAAKERGLSYVTLEQESFGGTVSHYPRGKIVMTAPVVLPIVGRTRFKEATKESLLEFWQHVRAQNALNIHYSEHVDSLEPVGAGFALTTRNGRYVARAVLLSIGRRGTPRKLGVEGEDLSKVVYRLIDPEQYKGKNVLVVGGGDSALEAATSLSDLPQTTVSLSYRGDAFSRAKPKNRDKTAAAVTAGRLKIFLKTDVVKVEPGNVLLQSDGKEVVLPNDAVIVCAGGVLPTSFLKDIGIQIETKYGSA